MNRTLGAYHDDERGHYTFSYIDNDGKHVEVRFRAEPDWDLDTIFNEFRNFLIASGHDIEGQIGELHHEDDEWDGEPEYSNEKVRADNLLVEQNRAYREAAVQNFQNKTQDKFSMDHFPNNGWPFGGLTTASIPALTSFDLSSMTVTDLSTLTSKSWTEWSAPTMAPLTSRQVQSWSLPTEGIKALTSADISAWSMPMPGTAGSAQYKWPDKDAY